MATFSVWSSAERWQSDVMELSRAWIFRKNVSDLTNFAPEQSMLRDVALRAPSRKLRGALPCLSADDQGPSEREVTDHGGRVGLGKRDLIHTSSRAPRVVAMGWHPTLQSPSGVLGMDLALDHPHFHHVTGGASRVVDTRLYQIPFSLCLRPSLCRHIGIGQGDNRLPLVNQIDRIR